MNYGCDKQKLNVIVHSAITPPCRYFVPNRKIVCKTTVETLYVIKSSRKERCGAVVGGIGVLGDSTDSDLSGGSVRLPGY